jgi:ADP-ribosylglycohydrolase
MSMLIPLGISDGYGAGFEFSPANLQYNTLLKYVKHPKYEIGNGRYTDDTQMAAALAEHLIENRPILSTAFAQSFLDAHNRDPRDGYSKRVKHALLHAKNGVELVRLLSPNKSNGNGACMRAPVLAFLKDEQSVLHVAAEQALATHDSVEGVQSAQAIGLAGWALRNKKCGRAELIDFLRDRWIRVERSGNPGEAGHTVWTSLLALRAPESRTLSDIMRIAVSFGGDTDTVSAIAVALGTQSSDIRQTVPKALFDGFERGAYGLSYLSRLDGLLEKL